MSFIRVAVKKPVRTAIELIEHTIGLKFGIKLAI